MIEPQFSRKLGVFFCADVEGYSRLTEDDEVGSYRRLRTYLNLFGSYIEAHQGRGNSDSSEFSRRPSRTTR